MHDSNALATVSSPHDKHATITIVYLFVCSLFNGTPALSHTHRRVWAADLPVIGDPQIGRPRLVIMSR